MWRKWVRAGSAVFDRLARLRIPTIAALNGYTFGGGLELALACDLRIAAETAPSSPRRRSRSDRAGLGRHLSAGRTDRSGRAKQLIFTGARISADQAERWGLVNEVVPGRELMHRSREIATEIAANAPISVQLAKAAIDGAAGSGTGIALEAMAGALAATTEDAREGIAAFREKRSPDFRDRRVE